MGPPHLMDAGELDRLAEEQAALREVATVLARGAPPDELFATVAEQVAHVLHVPLVSIVRYEDDHTATECASFSESGAVFPVGARWSLDGTNVVRMVLDAGRAARIDDHTGLEGVIAETVRRQGIRSTVGIPIVVAGRRWGAMVASSAAPQPLAEETEERLSDFTELVATAIANTEAQEEVARLAAEQTALRRVATLVARGVAPAEVFSAVVREVGQLLDVSATHMGRYDADGGVTAVSSWSRDGVRMPLGTRSPLDATNVSGRVFTTGRPARKDHYDDASPHVAAVTKELGIRSSAAAPIVVDGKLWGVMIASSNEERPLAADTESRIAAFTELVATAISNTEARIETARLADEQAALRRVATLVAQDVPPSELFAAVAEEVGRLIDADLSGMIRFEADATVTPVATWAALGEHPDVPDRWPTEEGDPATLIAKTRGPARIDDWSDVPGPLAAFARDQLGISSSVGSPIFVEGRLWGALAVHSKQAGLPANTESRLLNFTELVGTAVANAQARVEVGRLADEQAALRRVATLVAREASPAKIFGAVAEEVGRFLPVRDTAMLRYEDEGTATFVACWGEHGHRFPVGTRVPVEGENVTNLVHRTGRSARFDNYSEATGAIGTRVRELGTFSAVGCPIEVGGRLWGVMVASQDVAEPLPAATESRVAKFTDLIATAISNIQAREDLAASRARIVATTDETRRRFERDLHDGVQQRLVSLSLVLRDAEAMIPPELEGSRVQLSRVGEELKGVLEDLRELSRGIHPAILSEGGLVPALKALGRRSAIPVKLDLRVDERLEERVEVTAYYVVSEALANAAKHAQASVAKVRVEARDGMLDLVIQDDGVGGADPVRGGGLTGLADRVEALGGTIAVTSPANGGTSLHAELPASRYG